MLNLAQLKYLDTFYVNPSQHDKCIYRGSVSGSHLEYQYDCAIDTMQTLRVSKEIKAKQKMVKTLCLVRINCVLISCCLQFSCSLEVSINVLYLEISKEVLHWIDSDAKATQLHSLVLCNATNSVSPYITSHRRVQHSSISCSFMAQQICGDLNWFQFGHFIAGNSGYSLQDSCRESALQTLHK